MDAIAIFEKNTEVTGHQLERELEEAVAGIVEEARERDDVVQSRLAALEAEAAALQRTRVKGEAALAAVSNPA